MQIAAGGWHNAVVSDRGYLYVWGWNLHSQLGIPGNVVAEPHFCPLSRTHELKSLRVACGSRHTAVVTTDGSGFAFGWNRYTQCGPHRSEDTDFQYAEPSLVMDTAVADVMAKYWMTAWQLKESPSVAESSKE